MHRSPLPPLSMHRTPFSVHRTPPVNVPCLIASYPSGVLTLTHSCRSAYGRPSGPSVAWWQASMTALFCWSHTHKHTHTIYASTAFFHHKCCQRSCWLAGGDTFLQICLWEAGHAITSPGAGFYDWQMRSFDAGSEDRMGLVDYIMRAIEGTCHDRGLCNVRTQMTTKKAVTNLDHKQVLCTNVCHVFLSLECQAGALWALLTMSCAAGAPAMTQGSAVSVLLSADSICTFVIVCCRIRLHPAHVTSCACP